MTTVAIIQARMTSTRCPGKVMRYVAGKSILGHVIERAKMIEGVDQVWCAFPDESHSYPLQRQANLYMVPSYMGSEHDVLDRYVKCAAAAEAAVIVRITADCPLLDHKVCSDVIRLRERNYAAYASNVHPRSFPKGLDCEVFTRGALEEAARKATDPHDREHVTPFIIRNANRLNLASGRFDIARHRWTVDYEEDVKLFEALHHKGDPKNLDETLKILKRWPEISKINAGVEKAA